MSRYYIAIPDFSKLKIILKKLHKLGIRRENLRLTIQNANHMDISPFLNRNIFQTTGLLNSLLRGATIGGLLGLLLGFLAEQQFSEYFTRDRHTLLIFAAFGIAFGAWSSSLIGISVPNPELERFEHTLDSGAFMLWIEVPGEKNTNLLNSLKLQHPELYIQSG